MAYNTSNDDQDLMPTKLDPTFAYEISRQPGGGDPQTLFGMWYVYRLLPDKRDGRKV